VKLRKIGENKYIYYYIVKFIKSSYQFNFYFGIISNYYIYNKFNIIDDQPKDNTIPCIEKLIVEETDKQKKMILFKIILFINNK
jgi:hypothetical protein